MRFSQKILKLMAQSGLNQSALAAALKVSQPTVGRWLKDSAPHPTTAQRLADFFNVPVEALIDDGPFEQYLDGIREDRHQVEEAYPGNEPAQMHGLDYLQQKRQMQREAEKLRHTIAELASIAYALDPSDERLHQIYMELKKEK